MPQTDFNQQEQLAEARRLRRLEQRKRQRVQIRPCALRPAHHAVLSARLLIFRGCRADKTAANQPSAPKAASNQITTEPDLTITVAAVGDIMIDDDLLAAALPRKNGTHDFSRSFAAVAGRPAPPMSRSAISS